MRKLKRGLQSDEILLQRIREQNGLSQYELSRKLKWPIGRIDGSVRRLLRDDKIFIRVMERNGRTVNLVYPKENKPASIIEVPAQLLHAENPTWLDYAFVYALDSTTIGIAGHEMPEWAEISCLVEKIPIERTPERVIIQIPEKIKRFYDTDRRHRVVSVNGNNLLITISGNVIEQKTYPS